MDIIKYIILGIIQGITEPLPISSSGHIRIFKSIFNTNMFNDLNFEIISNFGSFLAILFIFRKDISKLIKGFFNYLFIKNKIINDTMNEETKISIKEQNFKKKEAKPSFKYCLLLLFASIPVGITGILFKDILEEKLASIKIVGIALLITALALFVVKNIKGSKEDKDITLWDAILIGLLQGIAIIPGISRSGTVLVGCLLRDFKRETALKFTFMLYFPVSIVAMGLGIFDILKDPNLSTIIIPYILGMLAAGIITYFAYKWLSKLVKEGKLIGFAIYCVIIGLFVLYYFR